MNKATDEIVRVPRNARCTDDIRVVALVFHAQALLNWKGNTYAELERLRRNLDTATLAINLPTCPKCGGNWARRGEDSKTITCDFCRLGESDADAA